MPANRTAPHEGRMDAERRLRRLGLWEAAAAYRERLRADLRAEGKTKAQANDESWAAMAEAYPPAHVAASHYLVISQHPPGGLMPDEWFAVCVMLGFAALRADPVALAKGLPWLCSRAKATAPSERARQLATAAMVEPGGGLDHVAPDLFAAIENYSRGASSPELRESLETELVAMRAKAEWARKVLVGKGSKDRSQSPIRGTTMI